VTQCKQPDSLLQERGEGLSPLEADHDQVGPVELCEVEGVSAVDECTPSLGVMEAPGTLVVARIPSVNVPVCVVSKCVFTSVAKCVLKITHSVSERLCVKQTARVGEIASLSEKVCVDETPCMKGTPYANETPRVKETACVREKVCVTGTACVSGMVCVGEMACVVETPVMDEARCVRGTACVRSRYEREMTVGMREHATECHDMVCVRGMATTTAPDKEGQRPSSGRSCFGDCAGFARQRARGSGRAAHEAAACSAARVKPGP